MLEVENKYRTGDWAAIRELLFQWGASDEPPHEDTDHYFNAPDRDFAETGEAFRLRRVGTMNVLTFKGPKLKAGGVKARVEMELSVGSGPQAATTAVKMLHALGYRPVAVVAKLRQQMTFRREEFEFTACFDDVGYVGKYIELETLCETAQLQAAQEALKRVAAELGLTNLEPRSYLELLMAMPPSGVFRARA